MDSSTVFTKVFWMGLIQLLITTVAELFLTNSNDATPWVISFSVVIAVLSYFGRNVRGQWASIISIIVSALVNFFNLHHSMENITRQEIIGQLLSLLSAIMGIFFTSPVKSLAYEHQPQIEQATKQAERAAPTPRSLFKK